MDNYNIYEVEYLEIEEKKDYDELIKTVLAKCFEIEKLSPKDYYINIILTTPNRIREYNQKYRKIDKETDVLSFPMFEKDEIGLQVGFGQEVLGDLIISIERVKEQAKEYGHSFEREFSYMLVHGFYHIMGEDHIEEKDKEIMREKEETVLQALKIER